MPDWFVNAPRSDHFIVAALLVFIVVVSYSMGKNFDASGVDRYESEDYGQSGKFSKSSISESVCNGNFWEDELQDHGVVQAYTSSSPSEIEDNRFDCQLELDVVDGLESSNGRVTIDFSGVLNSREQSSVTSMARDGCDVFTDLVDPNIPENEEDEARYDLDQRTCLPKEDANEDRVTYSGYVSRDSWGLDVTMVTEALEPGEASHEFQTVLNGIVEALQAAEFELTS